MIYYFSGTGNSRYVARKLAFQLGTEAVTIRDNLPDSSCRNIGIVFPVYAWGLPKPVVHFIQRLRDAAIGEDAYIWCVMTCGDETGNAPAILRRELASSGLKLSALWSIIMPNVYVLLPGFDVDKKEVECKKLAAAPARIDEIAAQVKRREHVTDVTRGSWPRMKTAVVYPLFLKYGVNTQKFRSTDACISCGRCAEVCPQDNIRLTDGHPQWGDDCSSCLGCYHACPAQAIEYGKATRNKGHYSGPR